MTDETRTGRSGRYELQPQGYRAFIPAPLPPSPPLGLTPELVELLARAEEELGRLDGSTQILPSQDLFVAMYVRKEAVLSSQIEGTQSSLNDLLAAEARVLRARQPQDVGEVVCWGDSTFGQTDAPEGTYRTVSATETHTCAIRESGKVDCWGDDSPTDVPVGVYRSVAAGDDYNCAIRESGEVDCWDVSTTQVLCEASTSDVETSENCRIVEKPVGVQTLPGIRYRSLSAGDYYFCGITETSRVRCWGDSGYGKTDVPEEPAPAPAP